MPFLLWNIGLVLLRFFSLCFSKDLIKCTKVLFQFWGGENLDLLFTREDQVHLCQAFLKNILGVLGFCRNAWCLMYSSGKLCCVVRVSLKALLKIWIFEGVKLMIDKFGTLGSIISSSFDCLSLHLGHEEKNDLLRNYSHFFQLVSEHLAHLAQ